jgi:hypothetical protein
MISRSPCMTSKMRSRHALNPITHSMHSYRNHLPVKYRASMSLIHLHLFQPLLRAYPSRPRHIPRNSESGRHSWPRRRIDASKSSVNETRHSSARPSPFFLVVCVDTYHHLHKTNLNCLTPSESWICYMYHSSWILLTHTRSTHNAATITSRRCLVGTISVQVCR